MKYNAKRFIRLRRDPNYAIRNDAIQKDTNLNDAIQNGAIPNDFKFFYSNCTSAATSNEFGRVYVATVFYIYSLAKPTLLY